MWKKATAQQGIPCAAQSGHFFGVVDGDWMFETWGRRARAKMKFAIKNYHSNSTRTDRFLTPSIKSRLAQLGRAS